MGNCMSVEEKAERERSMAIDKQIEEDSKRFRKECKILLLFLAGSGESGKSTIVKQMKIIHQNGYTREELMVYRYTIYKNLVESAIVSAMGKIGVDPVEPINRQYAEEIGSFELPKDIDSYSLPESLATAIESVWKDPIIAQVMDRSNEFYLMDSAGYFFAQVQRICSKGYVPNENDVLRARAKTTGITETRFNMGQLSIHMFDVGGQRSERKKWIHCFEAVTSIIFCVALSEYDQVLLEEKEQVCFSALSPVYPLTQPRTEWPSRSFCSNLSSTHVGSCAHLSSSSSIKSMSSKPNSPRCLSNATSRNTQAGQTLTKLPNTFYGGSPRQTERG
ncbi:putative G-protein alpha subunit [Rhizoctonia solani AG-1 IA]|uniref:Putative G-protein alpha subunit n=1 Tax=Thanatephorus cucumeris (strain AG1-IA) TaxID=983506 RepID=L8WZ00_THACA|nr:putative G-protein alpha subunit [Rhizoctonia solani AG-1 IA]